eukprot:11219989-Lingulodinium_polyedra.AAC.1
MRALRPPPLLVAPLGGRRARMPPLTLLLDDFLMLPTAPRTGCNRGRVRGGRAALVARSAFRLGPSAPRD